MNTKAFMDMLIASIPSDNIDQLLQAISDTVHDEGQCPFCGEEDIPVDRDGHEIEGDDVHDDECPVALLEAARQGHF